MSCPTCDAIRLILKAIPDETKRRAVKGAKKAVKRKASAYSKRYGAAFRKLKRKHPRTAFKTLSKRAHKLARRK